MRRPKNKAWRAEGSDCIRHRYTSHGNENTVTITVTEHETTGKLFVEFHDVEGDVTVLYGRNLHLNLTPGQ